MLKDLEHKIFLALSRHILMKLSYIMTKRVGTTGTTTKVGLDVRSNYTWRNEHNLKLEDIAPLPSKLISPNSTDRYKIKKQQQSVFYEAFPEGSTYISLTPDPFNYQATPLFENNSECILWEKTNRAGKPVMEASFRNTHLDHTADYLARLSYSNSYLSKHEKNLKFQLKRGITFTKKIYLQDFLWHYTRPIKLWRKNAQFYHNHADYIVKQRRTDLTVDMIEIFANAKDDIITTCCGNHNCINPEHLTIIPGTWVDSIYHHPARCTHSYESLRKLEQSIVEGKEVNYTSDNQKDRAEKRRNYISNEESLFPAKILSGDQDYCDNFEFNGFAELLDPNDYLRELSPDNSRPLGYGLVLNNPAFSYSEENHPFGLGAEKMSTLISGGNLRVGGERSRIIVQQVKKDEKIVEAHGIVQNYSVNLPVELKPLHLIY